MKKQLNLKQIMDFQHRRGYRFEEKPLLDYLKSIQKEDSDCITYEYVPIKLVACFEEFFRGKYQEIIDLAEFRKRLKQVSVFKNINYDFDIIGAFQDNEISLGDYLSHLIPCSKFEDINSTLTELLDINFADRIKGKSKNSGDLLNSINEIFRLRHIFCHEVPETVEMDYQKAVKLIDDADTFLSITDKIISEIIYPNIPDTTVEMHEESVRMLEKAENELHSLINKIQSQDKEGIVDFTYIDAWKQYRETRAKIESSIVEEGSMHDIVYLSSKESTTRALIKELNNDYKFLLR